MVSDAEVVTQALLQVLQGRVGLVLAMVDPRKEQVRVRVGRVQAQALVEDSCSRVHVLQCHLRLRQKHLRWNKARDEARQRLENLDASGQGATRLRALRRGRRAGVLQVLSSNLQHEVGVQLNEEVVANGCLERSDVKRQGLVEQPERRIDIFPLPPRQDGLQERKVRRLPDGDLDLTQEFELLLRVVQVPLLDAAMDDAV
mmetsp:Transcript_97375/g.272507  ORF Transcript_97375/g.272507 Transcript_97375/m.272507 type:complete len:201 (-) Transcript_97375:338-940(-)